MCSTRATILYTEWGMGILYTNLYTARMAGRPRGPVARSVHIQFRVTPMTAARLDAMRNGTSRGNYARALLARQLQIEEKDATP